jgi:DNA invertase Pin-like site-specific DNA recombinase
VNRLKPEKLARVLDMRSAGSGIREIERATGVHRETIGRTLDRIVEDRLTLIRFWLDLAKASSEAP